MTGNSVSGYNTGEITREMRKRALERLALIDELMEQIVRTAADVTVFQEKPRKYNGEDEETLYMREVHFAVALGPEESITMSEMAERLHVTRGAVTQMADRLERKGYVARAKDPGDKRQTMVSLTEKGRTLRAEHIAYDRRGYRFISEFLEEFSDEDLKKFIRYERAVQELFTSRT